jgi:SAM-dependent methyltransferase
MTTELKAYDGWLVHDRLKLMFEIDHKWFLPSRTPQSSPYLGYLPYQLGDFVGVMSEVTREATGNKFLDVGCGPGVKMAAATTLFGYESDGVEINMDMAIDAGRLTAATDSQIWVDDALAMPDGFYGDYDVLWLYRPFRDPLLETKLEDRIRNEMKPGAILAGGAWQTEAPEWSWRIVLDDWELRRGAWAKPA